jgi:6,7-dimethyl-8-ribityllumazine synthase
MATSSRNLSDYENNIPTSADVKIGIVVSEWNKEITFNLRDGAIQALKENGITDKNLEIQYVPGAFELPLAAQYLFEYTDLDGIIAIGVVIQGETKHFDYVCEGVTQGIKDINLKYNKPVSFCVLTDNNIQQSRDRSGGKHGNKGIECAVACLKMIHLKKSLLK